MKLNKPYLLFSRDMKLHGNADLAGQNVVETFGLWDFTRAAIIGIYLHKLRKSFKSFSKRFKVHG